MKLSTSIVSVKKITSNVPRSNFNEDELERSANLILAAEGIINPIVLRRTSIDSYEVVDGDFEYYAAARAREIDPRKGEMVSAFILESENEEVIKEQVKLLRKPKPEIVDKGNSVSNGKDTRLTNLESRQIKFESRVDDQINDLKQKLENELKELKSQIPKRIEALEAFNTLSEIELISKFRNVGITGKKATQIVEKIRIERKNKKFKSLRDVVERIKITSGKREEKGISSDKMVDIVDSW
jgi:vacuolar-type H+-ATPase subunit I/STV1